MSMFAVQLTAQVSDINNTAEECQVSYFHPRHERKLLELIFEAMARPNPAQILEVSCLYEKCKATPLPQDRK